MQGLVGSGTGSLVATSPTSCGPSPAAAVRPPRRPEFTLRSWSAAAPDTGRGPGRGCQSDSAEAAALDHQAEVLDRPLGLLVRILEQPSPAADGQKPYLASEAGQGGLGVWRVHRMVSTDQVLLAAARWRRDALTAQVEQGESDEERAT